MDQNSPTDHSASSSEMVAMAFLFTDVVGSSRLMERSEAACKAALIYHDRVLRDVAVRHHGRELAEAGDGFLFGFEEPHHALEAALELQSKLEGDDWVRHAGDLRLRLALAWGEVTPLAGGEYRGLTLNRAARLLTAGHGGQILCGKSFAQVSGGSSALHDLGWYHLRDLAEPEQVFQVQQRESSRRTFPPLRINPVVPCNLPRTFTKFFGREQEIARVCELLGSRESDSAAHFVTLSGPGGTGKTRLSLAIAEHLRSGLAEAVWFVPLADAADAALIPVTLRDTLHLPSDSSEEPLKQVANFLAARPGLIVLDNFEQLLPEGSDVIAAIARGAPHVRWLITSRQRLCLPLEVEFPVEALDTPDSDADPQSLLRAASVQLFADRAQVARPSFELTALNAPVVAELCRKLEGVPLAIELAASRSDVVAPGEMLKELDERLTFCASQNPALPLRHRSLRAAIDWSYDFLPRALRTYFEALSVFRGGWSVEAARSVAHSDDVTTQAGNTRRALAELRAASLVRAEEVNGAMRFHMLETIRQYAAEKPASRSREGRVRLRHAEYFAALAERAESKLHTSEADLWLSALDLERENLRAALAHVNHPELLARLATSLTPYWIARALVPEGRRWMKRCDEHQHTFSPKLRGTVSYCSGTLALQQGDLPSARESFLAAFEEFRALGDDQNLAALLGNLGIVAAHDQDLRAAQQWFTASLELYETLQHPTREALALINLGTVQMDLGEMASAVETYRRASELCEMTGDQSARALALHGMAQAKFHSGDNLAAAELAVESLALNRKLKVQPHLAENALLLACISAEKGDAKTAVQWLGTADWLTRDTGALVSLRLKAAVEGVRASIRDELPPASLSEATAAGRRIARSWCDDEV